MGDEEGKSSLSSSSSSSWLTRGDLIVLAALGGTVVATVVVITVSVVLQPAHVEFAVARATRSENNTGLYLFLTINASSSCSSRHGRACSVMYRSVFVLLKTRSNARLQASVNSSALPGDYLDGRTAAASIDAWLQPSAGNQESALADLVADENGITVVIIAQVRFRIGLVHTRVYDIINHFPHVKFQPVDDHQAPLPSSTSPAPAAPPN